MVGLLYMTNFSVARFSLEFLFHPPIGFHCELDRIDAGTPVELDPDDDSFWPGDGKTDPNDYSCWAGALVIQENPRMVWRLTGEYDPATHMLIGRWPD
jgi:hypothetical protein